MSTIKQHYFQLCRYKEKINDEWQEGIANVDSFGSYNAKFIINHDGEKIASCYDYQLLGPAHEYQTGITLRTEN